MTDVSELIERLTRAHESHCRIQKVPEGNPTLLSEAASALQSLSERVAGLTGALVDIAELQAVGKNAAHLGDIARKALTKEGIENG